MNRYLMRKQERDQMFMDLLINKCILERDEILEYPVALY